MSCSHTCSVIPPARSSRWRLRGKSLCNEGSGNIVVKVFVSPTSVTCQHHYSLNRHGYSGDIFSWVPGVRFWVDVVMRGAPGAGGARAGQYSLRREYWISSNFLMCFRQVIRCLNSVTPTEESPATGHGKRVCDQTQEVVAVPSVPIGLHPPAKGSSENK